MSINSTLIAALSPIVTDVVPNLYTGDSTEYIVFNYSEYPNSFEDNAPEAIRYLVQVHWYLPLLTNPSTNKKLIKQALASADFTYPTVINASDGDTQHFVFECEAIDGDI